MADAWEDAVVGPQPDVVLHAPTDELTETEGLIDLRPNRDPERYDPRAPPRKRRRRSRSLEHASLDLYGGEDGLLVRTALIRSEAYTGKSLPRIEGAPDVGRICRHLAYSPHEYMVSIPLNARNEVLAIHEAAVGPAGHVAFTLQQLLKVAFLTSAVSMVMVHNHPSGDPRPSRDDMRTTEAVFRGAGCVGIEVVDHIIVANDGMFSFSMNVASLDNAVMPESRRLSFIDWPVSDL